MAAEESSRRRPCLTEEEEEDVDEEEALLWWPGLAGLSIFNVPPPLSVLADFAAVAATDAVAEVEGRMMAVKAMPWLHSTSVATMEALAAW